MPADQKRELATKVTHLMLREPNITGQGITEEQIAELRGQYYDQQIALREKHFSERQLRALLEFYSSEIGQSILKSQEEMSNDMGISLKSGPVHKGK